LPTRPSPKPWPRTNSRRSPIFWRPTGRRRSPPPSFASIVPAVRLPKISFPSISKRASSAASPTTPTVERRHEAARRFRPERLVLALGRPPAERRAALADPDALPQWQDHQERDRRHQDAAGRNLRRDRARRPRHLPAGDRTGRRAGARDYRPGSFPARRISPHRRRREPRGRHASGRNSRRVAKSDPTPGRPRRPVAGRAVTTSRQWMPRSGRMLRHGRSAKTTAATVPPRSPTPRRRDPNGLTGPPMIAGANGRRATAKPLPARGIFSGKKDFAGKPKGKFGGAGNGAPKKGNREADGSRLSARISSSGSARTARGCILPRLKHDRRGRCRKDVAEDGVKGWWRYFPADISGLPQTVSIPQPAAAASGIAILKINIHKSAYVDEFTGALADTEHQPDRLQRPRDRAAIRAAPLCPHGSCRLGDDRIPPPVVPRSGIVCRTPSGKASSSAR